jgi:hypothetical protein
MGFSNEIVSLRMSQADNPGHWKREEDAYLTQIGAMHYINKDPVAQLGYLMQQSQDGYGLVIAGDPSKENYGEFWYPQKTGDLGLLKVGVSADPTDYGHTLTHELGHAGQYYRTGTKPADKDSEELRQRFTDFVMYPQGSRAADDAFEWLWQAGMIKPDHLTQNTQRRK